MTEEITITTTEWLQVMNYVVGLIPHQLPGLPIQRHLKLQGNPGSIPTLELSIPITRDLLKAAGVDK